jgi:MYXO-CTERM domain-containing protein
MGKIGGKAVLALALFAARANASANIVIQNDDEKDKGFNDPTPVAPVGGNPGTTRGAQALAAFQEAATIWGKAIDSPVPIVVSAKFAPLPCTKTNGHPASAVPHKVVMNSAGAKPNIAYPVALANRLAGKDLLPNEPDIDAVFNGDAGTPGCLEGQGWYFGLDSMSGDLVDLVTTVAHELGHGLGMTSFVDLQTGAEQMGVPDAFSLNLVDERSGKHWSELDDAGRVASARAYHQLGWGGENVTLAAKDLLDKGMPALTFATPLDQLNPAIAVATFGPVLGSTPVQGPIIAVNDGMGSPTDACELPATLAGKVAFIEAGGCDDALKVTMVQTAGAVAAILASDTATQTPLPPTGGDGTKVAIPSVRITQADAVVLRTALAQSPVATLRADPNRGIGTSAVGHVYLDATDPTVEGVSVSHWDPMVSPHLLMHPTQITKHSLDLTVPLLQDLGWRPYHCGDSIVEGTEQCDPGTDGANGCAADCTLGGSTGSGGAPGVRDGGLDAGDSGPSDASTDAASDAPDVYVPSKPPPPNRYLDAALIDSGPLGITWVPKSSGCGCRVGTETPGSSGAGLAAASLVAMVLLRRRRR